MNVGHTLALNNEWDLELDAAGNIATLSEGNAVLQNVCNRLKLFTNDAYYDPERGVPHFSLELGVTPMLNLVRSRFIAAALTVQGVQNASIPDLTHDKDKRLLYGKLQVTLDNQAEYDITDLVGVDYGNV